MHRTAARITLGLTLAVTAGLLPACGGGSRASRDPFEVGSDRAPTPRTLVMMARLMTEKGDTVQAEYVLEQTTESHPEYTQAWVELGELQLRGRRFEEARATLERAATHRADDPVLLNNLGLLQLGVGEYSEAERSFRRAIEADGFEARYHANLATALALQGRDDDAIESFTKAVPEAQAYWNLGVIAESAGDPRRAAAAYAKADQLDPELGAAADVERLGGFAFVVVPPTE